MNDMDFTKGFNNGYLLAKHSPDVMNKLSASIQPENDYLEGMLSGAKQHEIELNKSIGKEESVKTVAPDKDHTMDRDR